MAKEEKAVTKADTTAMSKPINEIPGLENFDSDMLIVPRVKIIQALSAEVSDLGYKPGCMVNSLTKEILGDKDKPLEFVPVLFSRSRINFKPLDDGGGIQCRSFDGKSGQGIPGLPQCFTCEFSKWEGETPPACMELLNIACIPLGTESQQPIVISFGKTSFQTGRQFINIMASKRTSPWYYKYKLIPKFVTKDNYKYYIYTVVPDGETDEELYNILEGAYSMLSADGAPAYEVHTDEEEVVREQENMSGEDDTPF